MAAAEPTFTDHDAFMDMVVQPCKYMPIAATQHPPFADGVFKTPFRSLIACHFPSTLFTMHDASFAAANSSEYCRDTVSLLLLLVHCAHRANVRVFLETLYDSELCAAGIFDCRGYRLLIPVHAQAYDEFAAIIASELEEQEQPETSSKRKPKRRRTEESVVMPHDTYVNRKRIKSPMHFLDVISRMFVCHAGSTPARINLVLADDSSAGGEDVSAEHEDNTVYSVLDYRKHMGGEQAEAWYTAMRLPMWQRNIDNYVEERTDLSGGLFTLRHDMHYADYEFAVRMLSPTDGFLRGDGNKLRWFMQPSVEPRMSEVRQQLLRLCKNAGFKDRRRYTCMSDSAIKCLFVSGEDGVLPTITDFAHSAPIVARGPFSDLNGDTSSQILEARLYPLSFAQRKQYIDRRSSVIRLVKEGLLPQAEVNRVEDDFVDMIMEHMDTKTAGVPTMYTDLYTERLDMLDRINGEPTTVTRLAKKMLYFAKGEGVSDLLFWDEVLCSFADTIVTHQNATPQQLGIVLQITFFVFAMLRHVFGPQMGVCLQGSSDVGKTFAVMMALMLVANCMQEQENDASEKAWVVKKDDYMKVRFNDEQKMFMKSTGNGGNQAPDGLHKQSGMSTGVMVYNQYQLNPNGSDTARKHLIDCRGLDISTTNYSLRDAMASRCVTIQVDDVKQSTRGRSRLVKSTTDRFNLQNQAASLAGQLWTSAAGKFWVVECYGGVGIDMRMFEVFCAVVATMLTPHGIVEMMCRDIDKLRAQATGIMVARVTAEVEKREEMQQWAADPVNWINHMRACGGVVSMKDIVVAMSLCKPSNAQGKMDDLLRVALKRLVVFSKGANTAAETDDTDRYYLVGTTKRTAAADITAAVHRMNLDTNEAMMRAALDKLEKTSHQKTPCIMYDTDTPGQVKLYVLKSVVNTTEVMTDTEQTILEWLQRVAAKVDKTSIYTTSYDEKSYLFGKQVGDALRGTMAITGTPLDALAADICKAMDVTQRCTALYWLQSMKLRSGSPLLQVHTEHTPMFYQIFVKDTAAAHAAEPCDPDGQFPGKFKTKLVHPNSMAINMHELDNFTANEKSRDAEASNRHDDFVDALMMISGEAVPGDRIFVNVSPVIDTDTPAAVTHVVRGFTGDVVCGNPRRVEKSSVGSQVDIITEDTILPESKEELRFGPGSQLYRKLLNEQSMINMGLPFADAVEKIYRGTTNPWAYVFR
jgi:hypothetical protein